MMASQLPMELPRLPAFVQVERAALVALSERLGELKSFQAAIAMNTLAASVGEGETVTMSRSLALRYGLVD